MGEAEAKARAQAAKIKSEVEAAKATDIKAAETAKSELAAVSVGGLSLQLDPETLKFMNENKGAGSENLGNTSYPTLKIFTAGKSGDRMLNGARPTDGWFYYKAESDFYGEKFDSPIQYHSQTLLAHILTVSKGYRSEGLEDDPMRPGHKKLIFNQIMGGVIAPEMYPFIMYVSGKKLQPMWDFADEIKIYTKNPQLAIPMLMLQVRISNHEEKNSKGYSWVPKFDLVKDENNIPYIERNATTLSYLNETRVRMEEVAQEIILNKGSEENKGTGAWAGDVVRPAKVAGGTKEDLNSTFPPDELENNVINHVVNR